jgi:HEAT repeat protein
MPHNALQEFRGELGKLIASAGLREQRDWDRAVERFWADQRQRVKPVNRNTVDGWIKGPHLPRRRDDLFAVVWVASAIIARRGRRQLTPETQAELAAEWHKRLDRARAARNSPANRKLPAGGANDGMPSADASPARTGQGTGDALRPQSGLATPSEFREDVLALLNALDLEARTARLPTYLPESADVVTLERSVGVRYGPTSASNLSNRNSDQIRTYIQPTDQAEGRQRLASWQEVGDGYKRIILLANPGLGKSWLIRAETHRLCVRAIEAVDQGHDVVGQRIPLPMRCDQLTSAGEDSVASLAVRHLTAQRLLPARSAPGLQRLIEEGKAVILLDALDELGADEDYGRLRDRLRSWHAQVGDEARCVVTSRLAGYRGPLLSDAVEVELRPLSRRDIVAAVGAWGLRESVSSRLLDHLKTPAVHSMARIPLLLALLCAVAAELPEGQQLPATRAQLYERVLRWFLTRPHRASEHWSQPERTAEEVDGLLEILAPVAFYFATLPAGWVDLMSPVQVRQALRQAGPAFNERGQAASSLLRDLSVNVGILTPASNPSAGRRTDYLFLHRTFAEYLVAHHLAAQPTQVWSAVVDQHMWFDPDWSEVIPLLGAQLPADKARQLVEQLMNATDDPFGHALFMGLRVLAERPDLDHRLILHEKLRDAADKVITLIGLNPSHDPTLTALSSVSRVPQAFIDRLVDRVDGQSLTASLAAAEALQKLDSPSAAAGLLRVLGKWGLNSELRELVIGALRHLDHPGLTEGLVTLTNSPESEIQVAAARVLTHNPAPGATSALFHLLDDIDPWVRQETLGILQRRYTEPTTRKQLDTSQNTRILLSLMTGPGGWKRFLATYALKDKALTGLDSAEVTRALLTATRDKDPSIQGAAAMALAGRNEPEVTDALKALVGSPSHSVRSGSVNALATLDTPDVTNILIARLQDSHPNVRAAAARGLARRHSPEVTHGLLGVATDQAASVRVAAVRSLASRHLPEVTATLIRLAGDPAIDVRLATVQALGDRSGSAVIERLLGCLTDKDEKIRLAAIEVLSGMDGPVVTAGLLTCLSNPGTATAVRAVRALAQRNDPAVTQALVALLSQDVSAARTAAVLTLVLRNAPELSGSVVDILGDPERALRDPAAVYAVARGGTVHDLLILTGQSRGMSKSALSTIYPAVQLLAERVFWLLPPETQDSARADLAWLTAEVLTGATQSAYSGGDFRSLARGLGLSIPEIPRSTYYRT